MDPTFYADGTAEPATQTAAAAAGDTTSTDTAPAAGDIRDRRGRAGTVASLRDHRLVAGAARLFGRVVAYQAVRVALLLGLGWVGFTSFMHTSPPRGTDGAAVAEAPDGDQLVHTALQGASEHFKAHATFRGWRAPEGQLAATGDMTVVVSLTAGGTCWMGGFVDLQPPVVQADPTGEACQPAEVAALQSHLDGIDAPHS